jgi:hypothetical protein
MTRAYLATVSEPNAYGKPAKGPRTILRFISTYEHGASYICDRIISRLHERTGGDFEYSIEALPCLPEGEITEQSEREFIGLAESAL